MTCTQSNLGNAEIAELLAVEAEGSKQPLQEALRRASRKALLWPVEAACLLDEGRSLQELPGIGPYLEKLILRWFHRRPLISGVPEIRRGFFTLAEAKAVLATKPCWTARLKGDLQMHSLWSDGTDSIAAMAATASERGYEYIAITDHSKGLKIAGGIDERQLKAQAEEIEGLNQSYAANGQNFRILRSVELNLDPAGRGDMDAEALGELDLVLGCFHSALRRKEDQTERYLAAL
jgi:hypothetical protein